jgi:hypothetical protein
VRRCVRAPPLVLALASCLAAHAAEPPAPAPDPPPVSAAVEPGLTDVRWEIAPIRWRGLLALDLRSFNVDGQAYRREVIESASVQATSYVYQPWFAQLAFGLTAVTAQQYGELPARGSTLTGNGLAAVFPTSRFPFQANFERIDSRSSDQFTGRDFVQDRAGVRQSYRTVRGDQNASAAFDRSTLTSDAFGRDTVDVYNAGYARSFDANNFELSGNRTRNTREAGEHAVFDRLFGRHNYSADGLVTAETLASYGATSQQLLTQSELRNEVTQLSSFGTWRRSDDDPLLVTGGARFFSSQISSALSETEARSALVYGNANYWYTRNLLLNGGGSVAQNSGSGDTVTFTSLLAGGTYTADPKRFGEWLYTPSLGANAATQSGGEEGTRHQTGAQGNHGVSRLYNVAEQQSVALNLTQSLAHAHDNRAGGLTTFTNYGGVSYRVMGAETLSGLASLSASDSRAWGFADSNFQLVNLQLSGQANLGRYSSLVANYTVQATRQGSGEDWTLSRNGGGTYQHTRVFGVAQLRYVAIYERSDYQLNTRLQGDLNAPREQVAWSFEQRLEYRIGKLETRVMFRVNEIDGSKNALLFFRVAREFGD